MLLYFTWIGQPPQPFPEPKYPNPKTVFGKATFVARPMPFLQNDLSTRNYSNIIPKQENSSPSHTTPIYH